MKEEVDKGFLALTLVDKLLFIANIFLAGTIIFFSTRILSVSTPLGKSSLTFGIGMLGLVTILRILRKWGN